MTRWLLILISILAVMHAHGASATAAPERVPEQIELRDQFDAPQRITFPASNVTVLFIADQKGSAQVNGWVTALKSRYGERIDLRGVADVSGAPDALRRVVRRSLRARFGYPVMLDWSGDVSVALGRVQNEVVVLVVSPTGEILARVRSPAHAAALKTISTAIESAQTTDGSHANLQPAERIPISMP